MTASFAEGVDHVTFAAPDLDSGMDEIEVTRADSVGMVATIGTDRGDVVLR